MLPATPAGAALAILVRAANVRDSEVLNDLLGAYTPQELPLPLPHGAGELRVVEVLRSEPLRIEYIVESRATGLRHVGELDGRRFDGNDDYGVTAAEPAVTRVLQ